MFEYFGCLIVRYVVRKRLVVFHKSERTYMLQVIYNFIVFKMRHYVTGNDVFWKFTTLYMSRILVGNSWDHVCHPFYTQDLATN